MGNGTKMKIIVNYAALPKQAQKKIQADDPTPNDLAIT